MAIGTPRGFGRTRRPKAIFNDDAVLSKQTATTVTVVTAASLNDDITDTTAGENGYSTENQRYLHLQITGDDDDSYNVFVYGYNYAFGSWAKLYVPVRGTTAENSWKIAQIPTIDDASGGPRQVIIDIAGIDRVALVAGSGNISKITARMACSTF